MKTGWIITIVIGTLAAATGTYLVIKNQKEKKAADEKEKESDSESQSSTASSSNLWQGLSKSQCLALQKKINAFYQSGALSGFGNVLDTIKDTVKNLTTKAADYAESAIKTVESSVVGPQGFDAFKTSVASIMPLKEDGLYGPKTQQAVAALQTYLNANGARLKVDGLYGDNTDEATGWGIKALAGLPLGMVRVPNVALIK